ncbi:hypothetical protein ABIA38_005135 [Embleya sp. AB8]
MNPVRRPGASRDTAVSSESGRMNVGRTNTTMGGTR